MSATAASRKEPLVVFLRPTQETLARLRDNGNRVVAIVPPGEPVEKLVTWCEAIFTVDAESEGFPAFLRDVVSAFRPRAVVAGRSEHGEHAERVARLLGVPLLATGEPAVHQGVGV